MNTLFAFDRPKFKASWWCKGAHCQTIVGGLLRNPIKMDLRRERLELSDGDFLDLDWLDGDKPSPIVVIMHGLSSSSESYYIRTLVGEVKKNGWRAVVVNARGASGEMNRLPVTHHAGRSQDLEEVIDHLVQQESPKELYLVGYSLGGNISLKWLAEQGEKARVQKAVVISTAFNLQTVAEQLTNGFFNQSIYTRSMMSVLKQDIKRKDLQFPGKIDLEAALKAKDFFEYDREVTAKLNGFENEVDYWTRSSAGSQLHKIRVPTLLIHAANDPFLPSAYLPRDQIAQNPQLELLLTPDGGHLGFVTSRIPGRIGNWVEETILSFFR